MYGNIRGEPTVVGRCTHNAAVVRARGTRAVWVRYVPTQLCRCASAPTQLCRFASELRGNLSPPPYPVRMHTYTTLCCPVRMHTKLHNVVLPVRMRTKLHNVVLQTVEGGGGTEGGALRPIPA